MTTKNYQRICKYGVAGVILVMGLRQADAQNLRRVLVERPAVAVGTSLSIQVEADISGPERPYCGLTIDYGDGSRQDVRAGENGPGDFPIRVNHVYSNPGEYAIKVEGKFLARGFFSASACRGSVTSVSVRVFDARAEREMEESQLRQRELAARESQMRLEAQQMERQKLELAQKEQQQREEELALRRREIAARERSNALRDERAKGQSKPVATKPASSPQTDSKAQSPTPAASASAKKGLDAF